MLGQEKVVRAAYLAVFSIVISIDTALNPKEVITSSKVTAQVTLYDIDIQINDR